MKSCCNELTGISSGLKMLLLELSAASNGTSRLFLGASKPVSMDELKNEYFETRKARSPLRFFEQFWSCKTLPFLELNFSATYHSLCENSTRVLTKPIIFGFRISGDTT